jgi:phage gp46-like protein
MTDIRIKENRDFTNLIWDFVVRSDTHLLDEREELATAVRVALGTDMLADEDIILPDLDNTDRRGWWGDLDAESIWQGWPIGTKNWVLLRGKITNAPSDEGSTVERARMYTLEALQPFIDRGVCSHVEVDAARNGLDRIDVNARIYRGNKLEIDLAFQPLWLEPDLLPGE